MDLNAVIAKLKNCSEAIGALADVLGEQKTETKEAKKYSLVEVRQVLALKSREGHTEEIKALMNELGANTLSEVAEEKYAELVSKVEGL